MTNKSVIGKRLRNETGIVFTVIEVKTYTEDEITLRYRKYLTSLRSGLLVGVSFYGTLTPLITTREGVVRLTKTRVGEEVYTKAADISRALRLKTAKKAQILEAA